MSRRVAVALAVTLTLSALPLFAQAPAPEGGAAPAVQEHKVPDELNSRVPELESFHEVIVPLWHKAWPAKDYAMMKAYLPKVKPHVEKLNKLELPGILRDRKGEWAEGMKSLNAALAAYERAAAADDRKGLLDAVESLHGSFEALIGAVWPKTKELDAYHVVLYQIYHKYMPAKDAARLKEAAVLLSEKCMALQAAPVPKWAADKEAKLKEGFATLCRETEALRKTTEGSDFAATQAAVERVHSQYQAVDKMFE